MVFEGDSPLSELELTIVLDLDEDRIHDALEGLEVREAILHEGYKTGGLH